MKTGKNYQTLHPLCSIILSIFLWSPYRYRYFSKTSYRYRYFQNCLIDIDFDIDIDIDIFQNCLIDIDIDIDIFKNDPIDIDIDIFQKCRYIDNRYSISIYRTGLVQSNSCDAEFRVYTCSFSQRVCLLGSSIALQGAKKVIPSWLQNLSDT